jgi:2-(1,2-epoxy-1,2-dihydrophenyl)acetyl-CoA isomerase
MGASFYLPQLTNNQLSTKMLLLGDLITGEEAKQHGLVLEAVDQDKVVTTALELARRIADGSSVAVQSTIRTLRNAQDQNVQAALWREGESNFTPT